MTSKLNRRRKQTRARTPRSKSLPTSSSSLAGFAPVSTNLPVTLGQAAFSGSGQALVVSHREMVRDLRAVSVSGFYVVSGDYINPGNDELFPWLSSLASKFETYEFESLSFEIFSSLPTSTAGAMYAAVDYDAADDPPTTKVHMMQYQNATRSSIWSGLHLKCRPVDIKSRRYVLGSYPPPGTDVKTYDIGRMFVAIDESVLGSGTLLGELWVTYRVKLYTPQFEQDLASSDIKIRGFLVTNSGTNVLGTTPLTTNGAQPATAKEPAVDVVDGGLYGYTPGQPIMRVNRTGVTGLTIELAGMDGGNGATPNFGITPLTSPSGYTPPVAAFRPGGLTSALANGVTPLIQAVGDYVVDTLEAGALYAISVGSVYLAGLTVTTGGRLLATNYGRVPLSLV